MIGKARQSGVVSRENPVKQGQLLFFDVRMCVHVIAGTLVIICKPHQMSCRGPSSVGPVSQPRLHHVHVHTNTHSCRCRCVAIRPQPPSPWGWLVFMRSQEAPLYTHITHTHILVDWSILIISWRLLRGLIRSCQCDWWRHAMLSPRETERRPDHSCRLHYSSVTISL